MPLLWQRLLLFGCRWRCKGLISGVDDDDDDDGTWKTCYPAAPVMATFLPFREYSSVMMKFVYCPRSIVMSLMVKTNYKVYLNCPIVYTISVIIREFYITVLGIWLLLLIIVALAST